MNVLFKNRFDCFTTPGGDTVQMERTKHYLEKLGVKVDISLTPNTDMSDYDIIHIFNIMRPLEATLSIKQAYKLNKKIVFSSIYWDFTEFNSIGRGAFYHSVLNQLLSEFNVEKLKDIVRGTRGIVSYTEFYKYLFSDFKNTLKKVDIFLPNSEGEGDIIRKKISPNAEIHVALNAVDKDVFNLTNYKERQHKALIAARLDPRKNILNLVKAVKSYPLDVYGNSTPAHLNYEKSILEESGENVTMKGFIDSSKLGKIYNQYAMHIMPSWLETPGLSQLEAAACGCNIVSTNRGSTSEYFHDYATYCNPESVVSISNAVNKCFNDLIEPKKMSEFVLDQYTWDKTALQTIAAYEKVLKN